MTSVRIGGNSGLGETHLDVDAMTHLLVTASSGAGKSSLLRLIMEGAHGAIPQLVIDHEGEFGTLRQEFDYILVGRSAGCDVDVTPESARLLARKVLETRADFIVDLSEHPPRERHEVVAEIARALVNAPRDLWGDRLVVVDEAHNYIPQRERRGETSAAKDPLVDLASRGRKRGFKLILATQRLSKLEKDAAAECQDKMVGRTNLADDRKRAVEELAVSRDGGDVRDSLAQLPPGSWIVTGPALNAPEVTRVHAVRPQTKPPPRGAHARAAPPPREATLPLLEELRDLPRQAEEEAATMLQLQARIRELEALKAGPDEEDWRRLRSKLDWMEGELREREARWVAYQNQVAEARRLLEWAPAPGSLADVLPVPEFKAAPPAPAPPAAPPAPRAPARGEGLRPARQALLDAVRELESWGIPAPSMEQVAGLLGKSASSGGFRNDVGALRSGGLLQPPAGDGSVRLSDEGRRAAKPPPVRRSGADLRKAVAGSLRPAERVVLEAIMAAHPRAVLREEIASRVGKSASSGGFRNILGHLHASRGAIEYPSPGRVRAAGWLFPEAARA